MSTKHTQGPWIVNSFGCVHQQGNESAFIPLISPWVESAFDESDEIALANSNLIAAAPDLLSCLIEMVEVHNEPCHLDHHGCCQSHFLDDVNEGGCRVANARAAIAKATGEKS
jgi:hypothetical protein